MYSSLYHSIATSGFEPEVSEVDYLKRRLREEKVKSANAERARKEAEARCLAAVRERVSSSLSEIILAATEVHGVLMYPNGRLTLNFPIPSHTDFRR